MGQRSVWRGYLALGSVSTVVALYPVAKAGREIPLRQINKLTGNRLKQQMLDSVTGAVVAPEHQGKGAEVVSGHCVPLSEDELAGLHKPNAHRIEIERCVFAEGLDSRWADDRHYVAPDERAGREGFAVIRDAMLRHGVAGIGRVVMSRRERWISVEPFGIGLLATTLHPAGRVRDTADAFAGAPVGGVAGEAAEAADSFIEAAIDDFDPSTFEDSFETSFQELVRLKIETAGSAGTERNWHKVDAIQPNEPVRGAKVKRAPKQRRAAARRKR